MFNHPTARIIPNTLAVTGLVFACGFACGYGFAYQSPGAVYAGLGVGGWVGAIAATIYPVIALNAEREYWKYRNVSPKLPDAPKPEAKMHRLTLEIDADNQETYYLPATVKQLSALEAGLERNRTLSGRLWYGEGNPFTQKQFMTLRREMVRRGLAEAIGNSYAVTDKGLQAFAQARVSPNYNIEGIPEAYTPNKRFRQINRGQRGRGLGAR